MAPRKDNPTTTTIPTTQSTIPGTSNDETASFPVQETKTAYAGGYNPNYKRPTADKFQDPNNPYIYTDQDWQLLFSMSKDRFAQTQAQLAQIFPDQFRNTNPGKRYDSTTIYYFKQALAAINNNADTRGKQIPEALSTLARNPIVKNQAASVSKPPAYQVTNQADIKAVFKKTAQDMLGRVLSDGDLNRMVQAYQQTEAQYQKNVYSMHGQVVQQAPNVATFAEQSIQKDFGEEVDTRKLDSVFGAIDKMLMGGK